MSRDFNNLDDLSKYVVNIAKDSLKNEIFDIVRKEEQEKIQEEVYDKYRIKNNEKKEPFIYSRRMTSGGLKDEKNIKGKVKKISNGEVELEVTNITKGNDAYKSTLAGKEIAEVIEYGHGYNGLYYDYPYNRDGTAWQFLNPRPFIQKTIEELENNKKYIDEFKKALNNKGIEVED